MRLEVAVIVVAICVDGVGGVGGGGLVVDAGAAICGGLGLQLHCGHGICYRFRLRVRVVMRGHDDTD